jgi:DNA-binding transcriptional ArsR family regulator
VIHSISNGDKKLLGYLRQEPTRNILLSLQWCLGLTLSELSEFLEKSPSTVSFHLKKLTDNGIVVPAPIKNGVIYRHNRNNMFDRGIVGREIIYTLKDPFAVYRAFTIYKKSILNKTTMEIFETIYSSTSKLKRYRPINYSIDTFFEDLLFDVFPHPYHA